MVRLWPTMFAYQFLFELAPRRPAASLRATTSRPNWDSRGTWP